MHELAPYRVQIQPEWIDYNGHVRDAYYSLAASLASDDMMDRIGIDQAYRKATRCTLYTLEMHVHFLREIKREDELTILSSILDCDRKRIHLGCRFVSLRLPDIMASVELMLLHVRQDESPVSQAFPDDIFARLNDLKLEPAVSEAFAPASAKIAIRRR